MANRKESLGAKSGKVSSRKVALKKAPPMKTKKYVSPKGWTVDALEVFPYKHTGLACLIVQSTLDRDRHLSEIATCNDFATDDIETASKVDRWVYSLSQTEGNEFYMAHSGGRLQRGSPDAFETVLETKLAITKLCAGPGRSVYVLASDGYVGLFDGRRLKAMPLKDSGDVYFVAVSPEGTAYAGGSKGTLFRRERTAWKRIVLPVESDIRSGRFDAKGRLYLCGSAGFCGRLDGDELTTFSVPDDRDYWDVGIFSDAIYFGAGYRGLEILDGSRVVPFKANVFSFHLSASDDYLFAAGANEVARFDGTSWVASNFT